jgi:hypothetical protein
VCGKVGEVVDVLGTAISVVVVLVTSAKVVADWGVDTAGVLASFMTGVTVTT